MSPGTDPTRPDPTRRGLGGLTPPVNKLWIFYPSSTTRVAGVGRDSVHCTIGQAGPPATECLLSDEILYSHAGSIIPVRTSSCHETDFDIMAPHHGLAAACDCEPKSRVTLAEEVRLVI